MHNWITPTILEGNIVKLIPVERDHHDGLLAAASDGELWNLWYTTVPAPELIDPYVDLAIREREILKSLAFSVIERATGKVVGSTRYLNIEPENKRLEIGGTWYAKSAQRTGVNTECKYLLLSHAFEKLGAIAVEFRTHWHNHQSRNAIERLGAKQDGVLRNHRIMKDGLIRDTVVYSIIQNEWPAVKQSLEFNMERRYQN